MAESGRDGDGDRDPRERSDLLQNQVVAGDDVVTREVTESMNRRSVAHAEPILSYDDVVGQLPTESSERRFDGAFGERPRAVGLYDEEACGFGAQPRVRERAVVVDVLVEHDLLGQLASSSAAFATTKERISRIGTKVGQRASASASWASVTTANDFAAAS